MNWKPRDGSPLQFSESAILGPLTLMVFDVGKVGPIGPCLERPQWAVTMQGDGMNMVAGSGETVDDLLMARKDCARGAIVALREFKRMTDKDKRGPAKEMMGEARKWLSDRAGTDAVATKLMAEELKRDYRYKNVSEEHNCIFIHPRKTAGKSVENVVFGREAYNGSSGHAKARDVRELIGLEMFEAMYSFGFLRNPWERVVAICYARDKAMLENPERFAEYVRLFDENQMDWFTDEEGEFIVDAVYRFENIDDKWDLIASHIGVSETLPHLNESKARPYQEYFTDETRDIIALRCATDIDYGDFTF